MRVYCFQKGKGTFFCVCFRNVFRMQDNAPRQPSFDESKRRMMDFLRLLGQTDLTLQPSCAPQRLVGWTVVSVLAPTILWKPELRTTIPRSEQSHVITWPVHVYEFKTSLPLINLFLYHTGSSSSTESGFYITSARVQSLYSAITGSFMWGCWPSSEVTRAFGVCLPDTVLVACRCKCRRADAYFAEGGMGFVPTNIFYVGAKTAETRCILESYRYVQRLLATASECVVRNPPWKGRPRFKLFSGVCSIFEVVTTIVAAVVGRQHCCLGPIVFTRHSIASSPHNDDETHLELKDKIIRDISEPESARYDVYGCDLCNFCADYLCFVLSARYATTPRDTSTASEQDRLVPLQICQRDSSEPQERYENMFDCDYSPTCASDISISITDTNDHVSLSPVYLVGPAPHDKIDPDIFPKSITTFDVPGHGVDLNDSIVEEPSSMTPQDTFAPSRHLTEPIRDLEIGKFLRDQWLRIKVTDSDNLFVDLTNCNMGGFKTDSYAASRDDGSVGVDVQSNEDEYDIYTRSPYSSSIWCPSESELLLLQPSAFLRAIPI
ncbi:protein IF [Psittacid alphaherpesvirus 5]|uniref:Protein IF n=1 Tax=Psittacid alphaherpesvirus 5 TaxID=2972693 RepID=A0A5P9JRR7_9ALPH|nr:protein IF [Psittacid alphaherpesvirus 5]QFU14548.1 protein IF [Psittacid alphaherpesvirus 5]UOO01019.1 protein IF [Psittacid alphaherpesvirus 5]